jgi:hypothetical protein
MLPEEMTQELIASALEDAALVYFDGRLTEAALLLARAARAAGVAVLVEAERLRPGLQDLLQEADYVVTSAHFPQVGRVATLQAQPGQQCSDPTSWPTQAVRGLQGITAHRSNTSQTYRSDVSDALAGTAAALGSGFQA